MSKSWEKGSTTAWRKTRAVVLARDEYKCQLKLPGCTHKATHVHHTIGKEHGDDIRHLISACAHCNLKVGRPSGDPEPRRNTKW